MSIVITLVLTATCGCSLIFGLRKANDGRVKIVLRAVAAFLAVVYFFRCFPRVQDVFDSVVALKSFPAAISYFTRADGIIFSVLRWLTMYCVLFCLIGPWFKIKAVDNMIGLFTPVIIILNIVFLNTTLDGFVGTSSLNGLFGNFGWHSVRAVEFYLELAVMGGLSAYYLFDKIRKNDWSRIHVQLGYVLLIVALYAYLVMPEPTYVNLFGPLGYVMEGFDVYHRLYLYAVVATMMLMYFFLRNKSYEVRLFALVSISIIQGINFFYPYTLRFNINQLPLHLCNAGSVTLMFSFVFKNKPLFYFNFLINVLGSIISLIMATCGEDFMSVSGLHYWYTHSLLVILPIMGVALKIFDRPTFKMVKGAVFVFSVYFVLMCVLNPLFNAMGYGVDYFFLMGDTVTDKIRAALLIKERYPYAFTLGRYNIQTYPLYWFLYYLVYVAATFGAWFVCSLLFKTGDRHYDMRCRRIKIKLDLVGVSRECEGADAQPLNEEGKGMIKFVNFTKIYGNAKVKAVDDFNLEINDGEVFGFIGHNGAGKSTAIKSLVGIQSITDGKIEVCGYDIAKQPLPAKRLIGYVPDNHAVYERLTGREYANYVADLYKVSKEDREARLEKYLNLFKLKNDIDRQIKGYSHGMKQKLVVIAALIHEPKVWVLDEPLTGLDPTSSYQIKECMREHADKGNIVFFSSHVIEVVEKVCDRIAIIAHGKLQCVHKISDLKKQGITLEQLYLQYVETVDKEIQMAEDGEKGNG